MRSLIKNRTISRHLAWPLVAQAFSVTFGLVTSLAAARILGPPDRGLLAVVTLAALFAATVGSLGLPAAFAYFGSRTSSVPYAAGSLLALGSVSLLVVVAAPVAINRSDTSVTTVVLGALLALATSVDWLVANRATAALRWRRYGVAVSAGRVGALAGTAFLAGVLGLGLNGCLAALVFAEILTVMVIFGGPASLKPAVAQLVPAPRVTTRSLVTYGLGSLPGTVSQFLVYRLDLFLVGAWVSLRAAGLYAVAQTFSEGLMALTRATQTAVVPLGVREADGKSAIGTLHAMVRSHARITGLAAILASFLVPATIAIVLGSDYTASIPLLLILLPGTWVFGLGLVASSVLRSAGRPSTASWPMFVGLIAMALLDLVAIPTAGAVGAAVVSSVVYVGVGWATVGLARRHLSESTQGLTADPR